MGFRTLDETRLNKCAELTMESTLVDRQATGELGHRHGTLNKLTKNRELGDRQSGEG